MIHVVNKRFHIPTQRDVAVCRGTPLGNPYDWRGSKLASGDEEFLDALRKIYTMAKQGDVYLVCYCEPEPCHAHTIKSFIEYFLHDKHHQNT